MTNGEFLALTNNAFERCKEVLGQKQPEYSDIQGDRLEQFHRIAALVKTSSTEALWGLAAKHITSISDMVKCPSSYNSEKWTEKITDLHNYLFLLEALLIDTMKTDERGDLNVVHGMQQ